MPAPTLSPYHQELSEFRLAYSKAGSIVSIVLVLMGVGLSNGWITLIAPVLMGWALLRVTGIPLAEAQALATRGEEYRAYQRTTSAFILWFPKGEFRKERMR